MGAAYSTPDYRETTYLPQATHRGSSSGEDKFENLTSLEFVLFREKKKTKNVDVEKVKNNYGKF